MRNLACTRVFNLKGAKQAKQTIPMLTTIINPIFLGIMMSITKA